jgi:hypothetical protein
LVWAKGSNTTVQFPSNLGYPIGFPTEFFTFVVIYHYINDNLDQNVEDRTTIRFSYTPNLRQYSMGTLVLGNLYTRFSPILPPKTPVIKINSFCYADCLRVINQIYRLN